jgi:hypothetical protein
MFTAGARIISVLYIIQARCDTHSFLFRGYWGYELRDVSLLVLRLN